MVWNSASNREQEEGLHPLIETTILEIYPFSEKRFGILNLGLMPSGLDFIIICL